VIAANKRFNEWVAAAVGFIAGSIGNIFLLIPLWLVIWRLVPSVSDERLPWQRDAVSLDEAKLRLENAPSPGAELGFPSEKLTSGTFNASRNPASSSSTSLCA
jgi:hypothetical protein